MGNLHQISRGSSPVATELAHTRTVFRVLRTASQFGKVSLLLLAAGERSMRTRVRLLQTKANLRLSEWFDPTAAASMSQLEVQAINSCANELALRTEGAAKLERVQTMCVHGTAIRLPTNQTDTLPATTGRLGV